MIFNEMRSFINGNADKMIVLHTTQKSTTADPCVVNTQYTLVSPQPLLKLMSRFFSLQPGQTTLSCNKFKFYSPI